MHFKDAPLQLHSLFSDHAVFQHSHPIRVTGTGATPGASVEAVLAGLRITGRASEEGFWEVQFPPLPPSGPHKLRVECGGELVVRDDLWAGDVWLCAGQSNMQFSVRELKEKEVVCSSARDPMVRYFTIREAIAMEPQREVEGAWKKCQGEAATDCSAIGYYFAQAIRSSSGCAIGLVVNGLGDTEVTAWMPRETLEKDPDFEIFRARIPQSLPSTPRPKPYEDGVNKGEAMGWAKADFDDTSWPAMLLPGYWQLQGLQISGCVWFRRELEIPQEWTGMELVLELGVFDDYDVTYFNGVEVGRVGAETPDSYALPRVYRVPGSLVHAGRALLAFRIFDFRTLGGVIANKDQFKIHPAGQPELALPLSGLWKYGVEQSLPWIWSSSPAPSLLFNAMVSPLTLFPVKGALWYQGESDRIRAVIYRKLLAAMIAAWRACWGYDFPFFIVQLANFMPRQPEPQESLWAEIRESQRLCAEDISNSGLAVAIDIGEENNIHPADKRTAGERLARLALAKVYGETLLFSGPRFKGYAVEDDRIRIHFDDAQGLRARGPLEGFSIAGSDRDFHWAHARIEEDTVVVSHPKIPGPQAVRYGWQDNPPSPLENAAGLPASPFRTDDWELLSHAIRQ